MGKFERGDRVKHTGRRGLYGRVIAPWEAGWIIDWEIDRLGLDDLDHRYHWETTPDIAPMEADRIGHAHNRPEGEDTER